MKTIICPFCGQDHPEDAQHCPVTGKAITTSFLQIGKIVGGKYELLKLIGEGGVGFVYEARNVEIRNHVALKLVHGPMAENAEVRQRFIREAIAAAEIGHENIVNIFDKGVDQATGAIYIVMELLKGETLTDRIEKEGTLSVQDTVDIMLQVFYALWAAHSKGIVHRNLKPENIFLSKLAGRKNFVKILDFGIAKIREQADGKAFMESSTIMGTPQYMAPEQIAASPEVDAGVDVYACGVIMYEALVGKVPFDAPSVHGVIYKIMNEPPPKPRTVNNRLEKDIENVILRAMRREPAERFRSVEEFAKTIEPMGSGQVVFGRSSLLPSKQMDVPVVPPPEKPVPATATTAKKPKKKGLSPFVILLIVFLPLVSIVALAALVALNVFFFGKDDGGEVKVAKEGPAAAVKKDAETREDVAGDIEVEPEDMPPAEAVVAKRKLEIITDPPGAEILIDGNVAGTSPLVVETEAEEVNIEARLDGHDISQMNYEIESDSMMINIKMVQVKEKKKKKKKCDPRDPKCRVGGR